MNKDLLLALGYSEETAKVVTDFLGQRVTCEPKSYNNQKKKDTPVIQTNGSE
jgi:hypothetical protein